MIKNFTKVDNLVTLDTLSPGDIFLHHSGVDGPCMVVNVEIYEGWGFNTTKGHVYFLELDTGKLNGVTGHAWKVQKVHNPELKGELR